MERELVEWSRDHFGVRVTERAGLPQDISDPFGNLQSSSPRRLERPVLGDRGGTQVLSVEPPLSMYGTCQSRALQEVLPHLLFRLTSSTELLARKAEEESRLQEGKKISSPDPGKR